MQDGRDPRTDTRSSQVPQDQESALARIADLEVALARRTVTGQATGIVMERLGLPPEVAVAVLRRLSQESNRKLYDIAAELVGTGTTPGLPAGRHPVRARNVNEALDALAAKDALLDLVQRASQDS